MLAGGRTAFNEARLRAWALGLFVTLASLATLWVVWRAFLLVASAVSTLLLGAVLAFILEPLARVLDDLFRSRLMSALVLLLVIVGGLAVGFGYLGVAAFRETQGLIATLPALVDKVQAAIPSWLATAQQWAGNVDLTGLGQTLLTHVEAIGRGALSFSLAFVGAATGMVTEVVIALVLAFYFILDGRRMRAGLYALLPQAWREPATTVETIVQRVFGSYVRSQLLVALVFGLLVGGGMGALGLPYPLLLGLQATVFELLPTVGPILAAVAPAALALTLPYPHVWYVLLYFLFVQQLESNLLVPRISGDAVGLHPVVIILVILSGFQVDGLVGALAAPPVAGTAYAVLRHFLGTATRTGAPTASPAPRQRRRG